MEKLRFEKEINAPAQKVYETMLGLHDKATYEHWTAEFNPTSSYDGKWDKGSKIHFIGFDENGKKGGMVSEIKDNQPSVFVSIKHIGILDGDTEITEGEMVEKWAGGHENYSYSEVEGTTTLTVELDALEEYKDYFTSTYPSALEKLKEICEK